MAAKKRQLFAVAVALLIPIAAHAQNDIGGTAADPNDNQELQDVHMTTTEIVIDGDLSEWGFNNPITNPLIGIPKIGQGDRTAADPPSEFVVQEEYGGGTWTGLADHSSTTELLWNGDGLYIGVIVTDDYHENAANSPWNGDSLQMMITNEERDQSDFALYNYALGGIEDDHAGFENDPPLAPDELFVMHERGFIDFFSDLDYLLFNDNGEPNVAIMRDTVELTTTYEIFLGTEALGLEVEEMVEGTQLGLAMAINDGDEDAPGQAGWIGLGAHSIVFGKTASEAALLTFVGEFVGPTCNPNSMGDLDGNGAVEFADFLLLSANFGNAVADHTMGDIDCNGTVEFADFLVLSANFGSAGGAAASVPEPSSLGLLGFSVGFSVLFLGFLRRRRSEVE